MQKHTKTLLALTIAILTWSSSFVFIRLCLHSYSPGNLALFRYLIVSVTMLFFYLKLPKRTKPTLKQFIQLFFLGFFGIGLYMIALNYGEITVTASISSFIIGMNPVVAMLFAMLFFNEKISVKRWLGVGISVIGLIIIAVVIIIIVVFTALGIGDTKKVNVQFICKPWQPVTGGEKCAECGTDGYPCSRYACQSLGVNCRLLNEGTGQEVCTNIGAGDLSAPRISPMLESLSKGFKYDSVSDKGMKIVSGENDGCLKANSPVAFGIKLDEASYCRYNVKHTDNFDLMTDENGGDFGFSNIFLYNHTHFFEVPDLTSLGIESYDPSKRMDFNLYVRCIDGNGNGKDSSDKNKKGGNLPR